MGCFDIHALIVHYNTYGRICEVFGFLITVIWQEDIDNIVVAFQIAFDLYESASQQFLRRVMEAIASILPSPPPSPSITAAPVQETGEWTLTLE